MYTLLIADDEPLIRNGIRKIIDWESLGFTEILMAEDGQEALSLIRSQKVDLVLTDIVMPFMTGLELSEILAKEFPQIHVVILTGHEDFEYAQQSVNLGVKNYILKPVGADTLYRKMKGICEKLHLEKSEKQYILSIKNQMQQMLPILREQMLRRIVCNPKGQLQRWMERAKALNLDLGEGPFQVAVLELEQLEQDTDNNSLYLLAAKKTLEECLGHHHYVFEDESDRLVVIFCCEYLGYDIPEEFSDILYQIQETVQKAIYYNIEVESTFGTGMLVNTGDQLHVSYEGAKKALESKYSLGAGNVYDIRDLNYWKSNPYLASWEISKLVKSIRIGNQQQTDENIRVILCGDEQDKPISRNNVLVNYIAAIAALLQELSEIKTDSSQVWNEGINLLQEARQILTVEEMEQTLCRFARNLELQFAQVQKNNGQQIVDKVKQYARDNFKDPEISLSTASKYVSVSTGYLSSLFKKETGTNFVKYLSDLRMEKGRELLLTTDRRTYEIAYETGFANPHYFSVAFKKYTGYSPSEYRMKEKR